MWTFLGPAARLVKDTSAMDLFGSGTRSFVSYFAFRFIAAGSYPAPSSPPATTCRRNAAASK